MQNNDEMPTGSLPQVAQFKINPVGEGDITAEGNQWFCHAHEVKAYIDAAQVAQDYYNAEIAKLVEALERMMKWFGKYPEFIPNYELMSHVMDDRDFATRALAKHQPAAQKQEGV